MIMFCSVTSRRVQPTLDPARSNGPAYKSP